MSKEEKKALEEYSLEENFARLEETIEQLESDELPLEEAFAAYRAGMDILKQCSSQIDRVEKQVMKLNEEGQLEGFEHEEQ